MSRHLVTVGRKNHCHQMQWWSSRFLPFDRKKPAGGLFLLKGNLPQPVVGEGKKSCGSKFMVVYAEAEC